MLAFSGGSDSLALMMILSSIAKDRFEALYVNHGIRDDIELDNEIALNKHNARLLGAKLSILNIGKGVVQSYSKEKKCGIEASARALRYKALLDYADRYGFDYVLTAHHREDQVETVLMRMLDHSPFYTFQGICYQDGKIIRPFLNVAKREIDCLIEKSGLVFSFDSTNKDIKYKRNEVRLCIMPKISESCRCLIAKIADNVYQYRNNHKPLVFSHSRYVSIDRNVFLSANEIAKEGVIFSSSTYLGNKERLSRSFLKEIYSLAERGEGKKETAFLYFICTKTELRIFRKESDFSSIYFHGLTAIGPFSISHDHIYDKELLINEEMLEYPIIRKSEKNDIIHLKEGHKKVSELEKRAHVPYSVVLEDKNGIVAVFLRQFGGNDRLSIRFLDKGGTPFTIA